MKFKTSFTNLFLKLFLLVSFSVVSQDYLVEKVPNRYRLSWETVSMSEEPDLGFVGIGFDLFSAHINPPSVILELLLILPCRAFAPV